MFSILKDFQPDLIHFNSIWGFPLNTLNKIAKIYPVIITIRDTWILEYSEIFPKFINNIHKNMVLKNLKNIFLIAPSKFIYKKYNYKEMIRNYKEAYQETINLFKNVKH